MYRITKPRPYVLHLIIAVPLLVYSSQALAQKFSRDVINLAQCQNVYAYSAHLAQMQNNEGLAKNFLLRQAQVTVASFILTERNGVVSEKVKRKFKSIQLENKKKLDAGKLQVNNEIARCDRKSQPIIQKVMNSKKTLWGLSFVQLQTKMFHEGLRVMGIN